MRHAEQAIASINGVAMPGSKNYALIMGGAGGIGLAAARALQADGFATVLVDRNATELATAAETLGEVGPTVTVRVADVADSRSVFQLVEEIAQLGNLRVLINAAGILHLGGIADTSEAEWDHLIDVNLKGVFLSCKAVIPAMKSGGGGSIVNLSSQSGRTRSYFSAPDYVASKAGVIGLTMALAAQHAGDRIRVNCIAPGIVETTMLNVYSQTQLDEMRSSIPLGRFASAHEMANVVVFLATDRSSYITGQTINVNGGAYMA